MSTKKTELESTIADWSPVYNQTHHFYSAYPIGPRGSTGTGRQIVPG